MAGVKKHGGARKGSGQPPLGGDGSGESRNVAVRLPESLHEKLDALANEIGRSKSEVVRAVIERGIAEMQDQKNKEL